MKICSVCGQSKNIPSGTKCSACIKKAQRKPVEKIRDEINANVEKPLVAIAADVFPDVGEPRHAKLVTKDTPGAVIRVEGAKTTYVIPGQHYIGSNPDEPWVWSVCSNPDCIGTNMAERGSHAEESQGPVLKKLTKADLLWLKRNGRRGPNWPTWEDEVQTNLCHRAGHASHEFKTHLRLLADCGE